MKELSLRYLAGGPIQEARPLPPYDEKVCTFLADLSKKLLKDKKAQAYPDVLSFAFFCRKANLAKLREQFLDEKVRMGRGTAFHIAPSNVPVNCAFTYAFGLLAGNANIVRVSSKDFMQVKIICGAMQEMFESGEYEEVRAMTAFISYERSSEINDALSAMADVRIIWGGDATIEQIRKSPVSSRCVELAFADRYSFAVLDAEKIQRESEAEIQRLAGQFYNDTYLMDQNACSTPHLILWKDGRGEDAQAGKERFWEAVYKEAGKYDLADIKASDKYVDACRYAIELDCIGDLKRYGNLLYLFRLESLPEDITGLRGRFGLFFEYDLTEWEELSERITPKVQTCVYYGVEREEIVKMAVRNRLKGIDRIVPVGSSLDIGVIWDGYDIIGQMSRIIE